MNLCASGHTWCDARNRCSEEGCGQPAWGGYEVDRVIPGLPTPVESDGRFTAGYPDDLVRMLQEIRGNRMLLTFSSPSFLDVERGE